MSKPILKAPESVGPAPYFQQVRTVRLVRRGAVIPGYEVADDGTVFSYWSRVGTGRIRWEIGTVRHALIAAPSGRKNRYRKVVLRYNGQSIQASVHTLVMEAFVGPCPSGYEVCHKDGDGTNNRLSNLRYGTRTSNESDKLAHGTHQFGEQNPSAKLTDQQVEEIRILRAANVKLRVIAERFGVRESTVSRIVNGIRRTRCK